LQLERFSFGITSLVIFHLVILAVVQGITEFLPVSSSAHLILVPALTDWPDQGPIIDIAVHVGTLAAVTIYFRRDLVAMAGGLIDIFCGRRTREAGLAFYVVAATVPIILAGLVAVRFDLLESVRNVRLIAWTTLGFAIVLHLSDRFGPRLRPMESLELRDAIVIGLAQVLALVPGTSRSGITMTAARALGFERSDAARFSMLLSIPTVMAAGTLAGLDLYQTGDSTLTANALLAAVLAFVAAIAAISLLMGWLRHAGFMPFVVCRILLGAGLLAWSYTSP
jgi:undecaprenyl-diphosphatase